MTNSKKTKAMWEATASDEAFSGWTTISARPWDDVPADARRKGADEVVLVFIEEVHGHVEGTVECYVVDDDGDTVARFSQNLYSLDGRSTRGKVRAWAVATAQVLARVGEVYDLSGVADLREEDLRAALEF